MHSSECHIWIIIFIVISIPFRLVNIFLCYYFPTLNLPWQAPPFFNAMIKPTVMHLPPVTPPHTVSWSTWTCPSLWIFGLNVCEWAGLTLSEVFLDAHTLSSSCLIRNWYTCTRSHPSWIFKDWLSHPAFARFYSSTLVSDSAFFSFLVCAWASLPVSHCHVPASRTENSLWNKSLRKTSVWDSSVPLHTSS